MHTTGLSIYLVPAHMTSPCLHCALKHLLMNLDGACAHRYFTFWLLNFLCHQMAIGLFRLMGAIGRSLVVAYTIAWLIFLLLILLSGFVLAKSAQRTYQTHGN